MRILKRLRPQARSQVTLEAYMQPSVTLLEEHIETSERNVEITPMINLLGECLNRFEGADIGPDKSDGWLAPRIHASLRLYRREAANFQYWEYLSICVPEVREYILWRWTGKNGELPTKNRIYGSDRRHALGRLWWAAELTRNGPDYGPTVSAFEAGSQDLINYITDVDAFHNRAAAIAFVRYFGALSQDDGWRAKDAVDLGKALNHVLSTIVLDGLAPDDGTYMDAYERWVDDHVDETLMIDTLPTGPNEPKVEEAKIEAVHSLLMSLQGEFVTESRAS